MSSCPYRERDQNGHAMGPTHRTREVKPEVGYGKIMKFACDTCLVGWYESKGGKAPLAGSSEMAKKAYDPRHWERQDVGTWKEVKK